MRLTIAGLVMAFAFGVGVAAQVIQQPKTITGERLTIPVAETVTVRFQDADALAVLTFLGTSAGIEIRFAPDTKAASSITLNVNGANVADVFNVVLKLAALDFEVVDQKTVLVTPRQP